MALKKTLVEKLFNISKISSQAVTNCRISSSTVQNRIPQTAGKSTTDIAPDPGDRIGNGKENGVFKRFLHKGATVSPAVRTLPMGKDLKERLKEIDMSKDRIRLDGLSPHLAAKPAVPEVASLSIQETKKLLRVAQLEVVKTRLRETGKTWISHSDFIQICGESCSDPEQGRQFAKLLDESGSVIVLGNVVVLRPDQVAEALGGLIPLPVPGPNDPRRKELVELEKKKAVIDEKADSLVRRELWFGLSYLVVQTAGFMRLTFWELTWDVMEPICFYVTSVYFMAGYAFFLRTSREPSFEGFYQSRFNAKQQKLIKANNFDTRRYNELRELFYPNSSSSSSDQAFKRPRFNVL
ncbi:Calcium uniporter protein 2 [Hibiscus syriacus]|uniref:Calcium uniporter protein 2 n=1 Tax=Hibiscus syriacus TaxID=106335 RepID=A0A6A3B2E8_HIBSY|nr:calcium uniporter protein 2, mitochondrial-like [Hibiscus syriacus]KAE8709535.1 Calcium uniporter protein 2 [Hibiscus syriacus]